jgi:hypothetical protein
LYLLSTVHVSFKCYSEHFFALHSFWNRSQIMEDGFCQFSFVLVNSILETRISKPSQWRNNTVLAALCARMDAVILNGIVYCISQRFADTWSWHLKGNGHSLLCIVALYVKHVVWLLLLLLLLLFTHAPMLLRVSSGFGSGYVQVMVSWIPLLCVCVCVCACARARARCDYQYWYWICCMMCYCAWSWFCCVYLVSYWCGVSVSRSAGVNMMGVVPFVGRDRIPGQMFVPLGQIILKFLYRRNMYSYSLFRSHD